MTYHDDARYAAIAASNKVYDDKFAELAAEKDAAVKRADDAAEIAAALTNEVAALNARIATWEKTYADHMATHTPDPEPTPQPRRLPIYCSPNPATTGDTNFVDSYRAHIEGADQWATGFYTYWGADIGAYNTHWQQLAAAHPDGIPVLGSPKGDPTTASGRAALEAFFRPMPQQWRNKFIIAHWQEPEDNHTTTASRATFRARVAATADAVRPFGVRNAVHLQEWAINPNNSLTWAGTTQAARFANLAEFVQGIEDKIDYSSFSLYSGKGKSMKPGLDRIKAWTNQYLPGVPWGVTAAGSPVTGSDPIGGTARTERARIVREAGDYLLTIGGDAFGWFNFDEYNPGRDQLASKDPALRDALNYVAALQLP